jgi:hypothetical protein
LLVEPYLTGDVLVFTGACVLAAACPTRVAGLSKIGIKQRIKAIDRTEWRKICRVTKVLQEL